MTLNFDPNSFLRLADILPSVASAKGVGTYAGLTPPELETLVAH